MPIEYSGLRGDGLAEQIASKLRLAILDGRLAAEARLPTEAELCQRFGVSRATIREALKRLAAQNLLRSRRGPTGGTFVTHPTRAEAGEQLAATAALLASMGEFRRDDLDEARALLLADAARLAAQRRTDRDLLHIEASLSALAADGLVAGEGALLRAVVTAAHNPVLDYLLSAVLDGLDHDGTGEPLAARRRQGASNHLVDLVPTLLAQDSERAALLVDTYLNFVCRPDPQSPNRPQQRPIDKGMR